ncbi:MAG: hypothetical protein A3J83_03580 [Elusimicrobia bacterium RIFOXYA2_FULL_40_6]|nr:MAG: hypothetical protein A3J83_03580 [Elusimicrobia bacterium RIFOXYA2_FULL_40_6]
MKRRKLLLAILLLGCTVWLNILAGCSKKELATPQDTFDAMLRASKNDDIDKFIDCIDLELLRSVHSYAQPNTKVSDKTIKNLIKQEAQNTISGFMKFLKNYDSSILPEKYIAENARELTLGTESASIKLVFINRAGKWKLSMEQTFQ